MFDPRHGHHGRHAPAANIVQEGSDEERGRPSVPCAPLFRVQGYGGVLRDYFKVQICTHKIRWVSSLFFLLYSCRLSCSSNLRLSLKVFFSIFMAMLFNYT